MAHRIFQAVCEVKSAASRLQSAKELDLSSDHIGLARLVLNNRVALLKHDIEVARQQHAEAFCTADVYPEYKAVDLMAMGY